MLFIHYVRVVFRSHFMYMVVIICLRVIYVFDCNKLQIIVCSAREYLYEDNFCLRTIFVV